MPAEWPTPEAIEAAARTLLPGVGVPEEERAVWQAEALVDARAALTAAAKASPVIPAREGERLRAALGRANDRVDSFLASAPTSPDPAERFALRDLQETAEWYVRCLDDVRAQRPVRGLDEAEAAYASAQKRAKAVLDGR